MTEQICKDLNFSDDTIDPFDETNENIWVKLEHLGRYLFAVDYLRRFKLDCVADIACGLGYGLPELKTIANRVIGVDADCDSLERAAEHYQTNQTQLINHDLDQPGVFTHEVRPSSVDAIVSYETLEHLVDPAVAIAKFAALLKPQGILICSVPNVLYEPRGRTGLPNNLVHKQLFNWRSLSHLLEQHHFQITYRMGQACANSLFKRESQLLKHRSIKQRIGDYSCLHQAEIVRHLAYLIAYPTVEEVDGSYSLIAVAQKVT